MYIYWEMGRKEASRPTTALTCLQLQASKLFLTEAEAAKLSDVCRKVNEGDLSALGEEGG